MVFKTIVDKVLGGSPEERAFKRAWKKYGARVELILEMEEGLKLFSIEQLRKKTEEFQRKFREEKAKCICGLLQELESKRIFEDENAKITPLGEKVKEFIQVVKNPDEAFEILPFKPDDLRRILRREAGTEAYLVDELWKQFLKEKFKILEEMLPEAFAVCRAMAGRIWTEEKWPEYETELPKMGKHYPVQLLGGMVLFEGAIAEMVTGEGKTLVASLPVYLIGLTGEGVHVVTVNDYLAKRDATWLGPLYKELGLTVGILQHDMTHEEKIEAYKCDITYGTNSEFGFDYLRDNMSVYSQLCVQNGLNYAIIDEVDSILIDEARTPLIISGVSEEALYDYPKATQVANILKKDKDYIVEEEHRSMHLTALGAGHIALAMGLNRSPITKFEYESVKEIIDELETADYEKDDREFRIHLTPKGISHAAQIKAGEEAINPPPLSEKEIEIIQNAMELEDVFSHEENFEHKHHVENAIRAKDLYEKDVHYIVNEEGQVIIVDEFTGRLMPGRRFSEGMHQALEAKESVKIEKKSQTLATITIQNYFRMYDRLSGMTGTAATEAAEFDEIYKLEVHQIPTNKPLIRIAYPDVVYKTEKEKFQAVANDIIELAEEKRPVLVGTISIEKSQKLSAMLKRRGVKHSVLNAMTDIFHKHDTNHESEAEIVKKAGQLGSVTIATNMAGRGTDILLGAGVEELGGLHIIGTERHESRRIDNQLRGRAGRQGDPGSSRFYLSLDDDLMRIFGSDWIRGLADKLGAEEGEPLFEHKVLSRAVENAQRKVESMHFEARKHVLKYDDVMEKQRSIIYELRGDILRGGNPKSDILSMCDNQTAEILDLYAPQKSSAGDWDIEALQQSLRDVFGVNMEIDPDHYRHSDDILLDAQQAVRERYFEREKLFEQNIFQEAQRIILLRALDTKWLGHLENMDHLRDGIGLRGYAGVDPLIAYQKEGFGLFEEMYSVMEKEVLSRVFKIEPVSDEEELQRRRGALGRYRAGARPGRTAQITPEGQENRSDAPPKLAPSRRQTPKVGRNQPCPCGSGKKYKFCCGKDQ